jgi:manganese efflux pump family protein
MTWFNIAAIAVALAMDALAVAIAAGITLGRISLRQNFRLAWHFGLFQALMPIIGWSAGLTVRDLIAHYAHWVAFGLLLYIAQGMLREAFKARENQDTRKDPTKGWTMVMLSVATSLDALAVGFSLSMINVSIWAPAAVIGVVAGIFTTAGMHLGKRMARAARVRRWADGLGGAVLLIIGINILMQHGGLRGLF